ncbi:hypothetical protein Tco_1539320 [Tanacetum coccineum]
MVAEVPQTIEYKGGQLNAALIIIQDGPYVLMTAGNRKIESQWNADERKAANLDQRLKSLIMYDEEDVSSDDNEMVEVKVLMALADDENVVVGKESARNGEWVKISMRKKRILGLDQLTEEPSSSGQTDLVFVKSSADDTKVSILGVERPWLSEAKGFNSPNHDTGRILPAESQLKVTDSLVIVIDSLVTDYDTVKYAEMYKNTS